MFLKVTRSGPRKYLQIMQAYRDPETGRPKQRYIGSLGRLDQLERKDLDTLIDGLLKVTGRPTLGEIEGGITSENTVFEPALSLGDVWAIFSIWRELRLAQTIVREARRRRHRIDIEQLVRVMVTNRLSDPRSKLGVLRWVETVYLPGIDRSQVTHQNLLRAMDALLEQKEALRRELVLDGKLVLITNVGDLSAAEVVRRYKGLADIERGFRVLKSEIEIAPVYHRLPDRIRAHALICFLALVIQRVMRWRIRKHGLPLSPEHLLERLKAIQRHRVRLATGTVLDGVSAISPEQRSLFEAIEVPAPTRRRLEEMA